MKTSHTANPFLSDDLKISSGHLAARLTDLPGWEMGGDAIHRTWTFKDHYEAIAFVNAIAWISHQQDHHPDLHVGYNRVTVTYSTHSASGVTEKDLHCAEMVSELKA